jgi:hypothetical protein
MNRFKNIIRIKSSKPFSLLFLKVETTYKKFDIDIIKQGAECEDGLKTILIIAGE